MIATADAAPTKASATPAPVAIKPWRFGDPPTFRDGRWRLQSERRWVLEGPPERLANIEEVLPTRMWTRVGGALVLNLINSVGRLAIPHVGAPVELRTGKLGEGDFQALLADLTRMATSLPFSAGDPASSPHARGPAPRDDVLYHAFVYLRYILSDDAPVDDRLVPALELIQRAPYRRWRTERPDVGIEALRRVDEQTLLDLVTRAGAPAHSPSLSAAGAALASRLGGQLPETVSERHIRATLNTPENRFVKAFMGQASGIIARTRSAAERRGRNAFTDKLIDDCDRMDAALQPILRHSMWQEVGRLRRIAFSSTVLQRRRGYRHALRHFARIRLAPRIPLDRNEMRDLLELKDIAYLYELWTFFRLAELISVILGPLLRHAATSSDDFRVSLGWNQTFEWAGGVRLAYNRSFSRSGSRSGNWPRHSYSVPLRPDIALYVSEGSNQGLHLLDAKFTVRRLGDVGFDGAEADAADAKAHERRGNFNRGDLYKMHTYRDAIPDARSVWILYPGSEFRFFDASGTQRPSDSPDELPDEVEGVGAIPFAATPQTTSGNDVHSRARATLQRLLDRQ